MATHPMTTAASMVSCQTFFAKRSRPGRVGAVIDRHLRDSARQDNPPTNKRYKDAYAGSSSSPFSLEEKDIGL